MDPAISKIQKHVDQLKAKHTKLADENSKLKAQLAQAKQLNSRIRRIAKPPKSVEEQATEEQPSTPVVQA